MSSQKDIINSAAVEDTADVDEVSYASEKNLKIPVLNIVVLSLLSIGLGYGIEHRY